MSRVFKVPFAVTGDRENVPTNTQPDGKVSYEQGFGYDYQRPYDDPEAKDISRESFNGLLFDVTDAIGEMQIQGAATWSQEGAPYPINALVRHDGKLWQSKVENNNAQPTEGDNWTEVVIGNLAKSADLPIAGTGLEQVGKDFRVRYGTSAGTAVQGNVRVNGKALSGTVTITKADVGLGNVTNDTQAKAQTQIIAGTGLEGGGSLAANRTLSVKYGTSAGTAAQGNDSRIVNALQRGNNLSDVTNPATARNNLGLGTAATRNVGTSSGNVMEEGAFGLGISGSYLTDFNDVFIPNGFYRWNPSAQNRPTTLPEYGTALITGSPTGGSSNHRGRILIDLNSDKMWFQRSVNESPWTAPVEIHHTGNILSSTGSSTQFPMSQKAVTDSLNTKANTSTQVIAGTGLSGGGSLAANRTLSVKYGTTAGTAAQGNDSRIVNALQRGNNLSDVTNPATARNNLGLGTAATRSVGTSIGNVMEVGAFGLGATNAPGEIYTNLDNVFRSGFYKAWGHAVGGYSGNDGGCFVMVGRNDTKQIGWDAAGSLRFRGNDNPTNPELWSDWYDIHHTGNILQSTGSSTQFPMSQKAVTDALATKANVSNPGSMGIGVGQTWQDLKGSRSSGTTYTNTTGRSIMVAVGARGRDARVEIYVNGIQVAHDIDTYDGNGPTSSASAIVPSGATYRVISANKYGTNVLFWSELR